MGVEGRPLFTRYVAVWGQFMRLRAHGEAWWA